MREINQRDRLLIHARRLERERDEARERADTMFAKHADILDQAREQLSAERALADRLAEELEKLAWLAGHEVPNEAEKALAAWKEARSEVKEAKEL